MSKEEDNKAVVGRWFTEFWGKNLNLAVIACVERHCVVRADEGHISRLTKAGQLLTQIGEILRTSKQISDR
jgi:hypothetical protein